MWRAFCGGGSLENLAEAADTFLDLIFLHARIAEHQAAAARAGEEVAGDAVDADSFRRGFGDDGGFGDALGGPEGDVSAGTVAGDFCAIAQIFVDGFEQRGAMRGVAAADAAQVAFVHAGGDEFGEGFLFERGGVAVAEPFGRSEGRDERFGRDEVADTQRGKDGTGKCAEVDDAAFRIETLQRFERLPFVAKFAVVIVFDDDGVFALGPSEEREAAREGENRAGGELVRGSDESDAGGVWEFRGIEAVTIYRDREEAGSGGAKNFASALILRILDGDWIVALDEDARD